MNKKNDDGLDPRVADWWRTAIIDMRPGEIRLRGYAVEELIGRASFAATVWLLLRGELPSAAEEKLLEAALTAAVDHGPQAPGVAIARMAVTCGAGMNGALAAGVGALGDIHGGAGEQAAALFHAVRRAAADNDDNNGEGAGNLQAAATAAVAQRLNAGEMIPGFGHRYHPVDPRAPRLLELVDAAAKDGTVAGRFAATARAVGAALAQQRGRDLPLNIDGATAAVYSELGFPPPLCRGLFCLSRSVGMLAHAWEQQQQGGRNKGPTPPQNRWTYDGPPPRRFK